MPPMLNSAGMHVPGAHSPLVAQSWRPLHTAPAVAAHSLFPTFESVAGQVERSSVDVVRQHRVSPQWTRALHAHSVSGGVHDASHAFEPNLVQQGTPAAHAPAPTPGQ